MFHRTSFSWLAREVAAGMEARRRRAKTGAAHNAGKAAAKARAPSRSERQVMEKGEAIGTALASAGHALARLWRGLLEALHAAGNGGHHPHPRI
jgi:hypothetical protein